MSTFDAYDTNHDGVISRAEFTGADPVVRYAALAAPASMPSYGPATTVTAPAVYMTAQPAARPAMSTFDAYDTNHDGFISRAEFAGTEPTVRYAAPAASKPMPTYGQATTVTAPAVYMTAQTTARQPMSTFDAYDTNHDGVITRAEFASAAAPRVVSYGPATTVTAPAVYMSAPAPMNSMVMQEPVAAQYSAPVTYAAPPQPTQTYGPATTVTAPPVYVNASQSTFERLDTNHDGMISRAEFSAMQPQIIPADPNTPITTAAAVYVTAQPFMQEPKAPAYVAPPPMANYGPATTVTAPPVYVTASSQFSAFDAMDTNHDGVLTRAEFSGAAAQAMSYGAPRGQVIPAEPGAHIHTAPPVYITAQTQPAMSYQQGPPATTVVGPPVYMETVQAPTYQGPATSYAAPPKSSMYQLPATTAAPVYMQSTTRAPATYGGYGVPMEPHGAPMEPVAAGGPQGYSAYQPQTAMMSQPATLFDALDTDHDGVLTRAEFTAAMPQ